MKPMLPLIRRRYTYRHAKGVTLVEVLVALIVLSIGLLGIAGLQAATTKYKINSWSRSANAVLYADLADRIRVNASAAGRNYITGADSVSAYALNTSWDTQQGVADSTFVVTPNCETDIQASATKCTEAQRAAYDMGAWRARVRSSLPQGAALVTGNRSDGFEITLMWFDKDNTNSAPKVDDATSVALKSAPTCSATDAGLAQQSCCPAAAAAPAGVRCARFTFVP